MTATLASFVMIFTHSVGYSSRIMPTFPKISLSNLFWWLPTNGVGTMFIWHESNQVFMKCGGESCLYIRSSAPKNLGTIMRQHSSICLQRPSDNLWNCSALWGCWESYFAQCAHCTLLWSRNAEKWHYDTKQSTQILWF